MSRSKYMAGELSHYDYYLGLAKVIGVRKDWLPEQNVEKLRKAYEADEHLNNIPLHTWDAKHGYCTSAVRTYGPKVKAYKYEGDTETAEEKKYIGWSLCDSVCCLKAYAKALVLGDVKE